MNRGTCRPGRPNIRQRESGVALVIVLWIVALVTITAGTFSALARTEHLQARNLLDSARARAAAEAGLHRAVYELRNPDMTTRWLADGRPYAFPFDQAVVQVEMIDERGKIDLNVADDITLLNFLTAHGLEEADAVRISDAVLDWRDEDDLVRPNGAELDDYLAAGRGYGPADGPFLSVEEFQQVLGVDFQLFQRLRPALTVHSRRRLPEAAFAPFEALLALPGMTPDLARQFIEDRELMDPSAGDLLQLPTGEAAVARGIGSTYSIRAMARLPNGTWDQIEAVIRLNRGRAVKAFSTLEWTEGVPYTYGQNTDNGDQQAL